MDDIYLHRWAGGDDAGGAVVIHGIISQLINILMMMGAAAGEGEHALYVADGGPGVDGGDELVHHGLPVPAAQRSIIIRLQVAKRRRHLMQLLRHGALLRAAATCWGLDRSIGRPASVPLKEDGIASEGFWPRERYHRP